MEKVEKTAVFQFLTSTSFFRGLEKWNLKKEGNKNKNEDKNKIRIEIKIEIKQK